MANTKITESIIQSGTKSRPGITRTKKWIVIHETGNQSKGAGASNHAVYLSNLAKQNNTYLSWHYTVDSNSIYHHIPDNEIAWHAGDGENEGGGNMAGIGIEICVNPESDYQKALDNAASLVADLLKANKLTVSAVKQHHDFSSCGKNCPQRMREQGLWGSFINKVNAYLTPKKKESVQTPKPIVASCFAVGESVCLNGCVYTDSYASKAGQKFTSKICTVTKVADVSRAAPYLLNNGLGWARKSDLTKASLAKKTLCVGCSVEVNGKLYTDSYGSVAVRTISGKYNVSRIINGRKAGVLLNTNFGWVSAESCKVL